MAVAVVLIVVEGDVDEGVGGDVNVVFVECLAEEEGVEGTVSTGGEGTVGDCLKDGEGGIGVLLHYGFGMGEGVRHRRVPGTYRRNHEQQDDR